MPDQACANGLKLDDIPQDLQAISTIGRRIISLKLRFFKLYLLFGNMEHITRSMDPQSMFLQH